MTNLKTKKQKKNQKVGALEQIINLFGGQSALGKKLGVKQQTIYVWVKTKRVPALRVLQLEELVKGLVTRHDLRPDLYPEE